MMTKSSCLYICESFSGRTWLPTWISALSCQPTYRVKCLWAGMTTQRCILGFRFGPPRAIQAAQLWRNMWSWQLLILAFDIDLFLWQSCHGWQENSIEIQMGPHFKDGFCWHGQDGCKRVGLIQKPKWAVALSSSLQSAFVCIDLSGPNLAANDISLCEHTKLQMFYPEGKLPRQSTNPGM